MLLRHALLQELLPFLLRLPLSVRLLSIGLRNLEFEQHTTWHICLMTEEREQLRNLLCLVFCR